MADDCRNDDRDQERPDAPLTDDERGRAAAYLARVRNAELTGADWAMRKLKGMV